MAQEDLPQASAVGAGQLVEPEIGLGLFAVGDLLVGQRRRLVAVGETLIEVRDGLIGFGQGLVGI